MTTCEATLCHINHCDYSSSSLPLSGAITVIAKATYWKGLDLNSCSVSSGNNILSLISLDKGKLRYLTKGQMPSQVRGNDKWLITFLQPSEAKTPVNIMSPAFFAQFDWWRKDMTKKSIFLSIGFHPKRQPCTFAFEKDQWQSAVNVTLMKKMDIYLQRKCFFPFVQNAEGQSFAR